MLTPDFNPVVWVQGRALKIDEIINNMISGRWYVEKTMTWGDIANHLNTTTGILFAIRKTKKYREAIRDICIRTTSQGLIDRFAKRRGLPKDHLPYIFGLSKETIEEIYDELNSKYERW